MLHWYFDEACTNQISEGTALNPDISEGDGSTGFEDERLLYVKNDEANREYRDITALALNADGAGGQVNITYSLDNLGVPVGYQQSLVVPDITDSTGITKIWRKVTVAANQTEPINRVDIKHRLIFKEYAK